MLELWYFTWVFLVIRPFRGYHYFWPVTLTWSLTHFLNCNLANNFWTVIRPFRGYYYSWHCAIDLGDPFFENFNLANNFWKVSAFLHMSISCDKIFLLVSRYLSLWHWPSLELVIIGGICVSQTHLVFI